MVVPVQDTTAYDALLQKAIPGGKIMSACSINLMLDNTVIQPNGRVKLMIPLTEEMKAMAQLKMVSAALNGTISLTEAKAEDGYMVLTTDQLGIYGIVGISAAPNPTVSPSPTAAPTTAPTASPTAAPGPKTGDSGNTPLYIVMFALSTGGLTALILKSRAKSQSKAGPRR